MLVVLLVGLLVVGRPVAHALDPDASAQPLAVQPCGRSTGSPAHYKHVIWIVMENHSFGQVIGSEDAPFENSLAQACGLATHYRAVTHPSLPNYLAATGGATFGVRHDRFPAAKAIDAPTVFSEVAGSGRQWRTYSESMAGNCRAEGRFGFARNPAAYFAGPRQRCARWDVPMGTVDHGNLASALANNHLPAFSLMIPNLCDATHGCPVSRGDAWLSRWIDRITSSASYRDGSTAVFLTWDEGNNDRGRHVPLIAVSPTTPRGATTGARFDHYSLLKTTADLLGITPPGHAAVAGSMRRAFGL